MSEESESLIIKELREENKRLSEELSFEKSLNNILENIRNNSLILVEKCRCFHIQSISQFIKHFNTIYTDLKTKQSILNLKQNQITVETIDKNQEKDSILTIDLSDNQTSVRVLRNSEKRKLRDKSHEKEDNKEIIRNNKRLKSFGLKKSVPEFSLVTEMLDISTQSYEKSCTQLKAIGIEPNITSISVPESSNEPSFEINDSLSTSEELTHNSIDPSFENEEMSEKFICDFCKQTFDLKIKFQNHLSKKHRIQSFVCDVCDYKTFSIYHLKRHKTSHSNEKPFLCGTDGCDKMFKTKEHLYEHKKLKHSNDTPFECEFCDYRNNRWAAFNYHKKLFHSNSGLKQDPSRPFKCPFDGCNKSYVKEIYLNLHKVKAHRRLDIK